MFIKCTLKGYLHAFYLLLFDNTLPQSQKRLYYMHSSRDNYRKWGSTGSPSFKSQQNVKKSLIWDKLEGWVPCLVSFESKVFFKILWDFKSGNSSWNLIYTVSIKKESQSSNSGPLTPTEQQRAAMEGFRTHWAIFHSFHFYCWSCTCMPQFTTTDLRETDTQI